MENTNPPYDYMIVGQGLAGTTLVWHLLEAGKRLLIVNDSSLPSSSRVAAGIFNPLTGRKLVKTWMADELFPYARQFYAGIEQKVSTRLLYPVPIYRPFRSMAEQNDYLAFVSEPGVASYVQNDADSQVDIQGLNAPFGGLEVKGSGWVNVIAYLENSRAVFVENTQYIEDRFDSNELIIKDQYCEWRDYKINKVLFCQGVAARENSLFDWLPFNPVKGQILDVTFEQYSAAKIVNQGVFILPTGQDERYRVGATYSWHDLDWEITEDGRNYLESKLRPLVQGEYTVHRQRAGIRPASKDRRPLIGLHPDQRAVGVFNGLGSKGVTLAPFFANEFVQYLENGKELNPEVNIDRYFSLYYH
jgi:glycine/D-amino acid oxidase-like deaminating enzyme